MPAALCPVTMLMSLMLLQAAAAPSTPAAPVTSVATLSQAMLQAHNDERARVGQPPLVWDAMLATEAQRQADSLARTGRLAHAERLPGEAAQGENLWAGTRGVFAFGQMAQAWTDQRAAFVNRAAPDFSATGNSADAQHYSQIVWSRTRRIGCATASDARDEYLVCRYLPAGNVVGERALP